MAWNRMDAIDGGGHVMEELDANTGVHAGGVSRPFLGQGLALFAAGLPSHRHAVRSGARRVPAGEAAGLTGVHGRRGHLTGPSSTPLAGSPWAR